MKSIAEFGVIVDLKKIYWAAFAINITAAVSVYALAPQHRAKLLDEDSLIENITVFILLASALYTFVLYLKSKHNQKLYIGLSALSFAGFLDEISFGLRLFKVESPRLFGYKVDAIHDFLQLGIDFFIYTAIHRHTVGMIAIIVTLTITTHLLIRYRRKIVDAIESVWGQPSSVFIVIFSVFIFLALLIDLVDIENNFYYMFEELLEMNAAAALLFYGVSIRIEKSL